MATTIDERFAELEKRLKAAEDYIAILTLLNNYGPAADSAAGQAVATAWTDDGVYDVGGLFRAKGHDQIAAMFDVPQHHENIRRGCAHVIVAPNITIKGDLAEAVAYTLLLSRNETGYEVPRASTNHWRLTRTDQGWRIAERVSRVLDGSQEAIGLLAHAVR